MILRVWGIEWAWCGDWNSNKRREWEWKNGRGVAREQAGFIRWERVTKGTNRRPNWRKAEWDKWKRRLYYIKWEKATHFRTDALHMVLISLDHYCCCCNSHRGRLFFNIHIQMGDICRLKALICSSYCSYVATIHGLHLSSVRGHDIIKK